MAGANRWTDFASIPWAGRDPSRLFYLSSGGHANTLNGNGRLLDAPATAVGTDAFIYDPAKPVIAHGGAISGVGTDQEKNDGAYDQRPIEEREDVLVYTSEALAEDLAVFGYAETELNVGSTAPDTDFTVKLVDVAPDGTAWNIADTIQRMASMRMRKMRSRAVLFSLRFQSSQRLSTTTFPSFSTTLVFSIS